MNEDKLRKRILSVVKNCYNNKSKSIIGAIDMGARSMARIVFDEMGWEIPPELEEKKPSKEVTHGIDIERKNVE